MQDMYRVLNYEIVMYDWVLCTLLQKTKKPNIFQLKFEELWEHTKKHFIICLTMNIAANKLKKDWGNIWKEWNNSKPISI